MERLHPEDPPHWYLAIMGVEPASQGRGVGTRLLAPGLEAIDASGDAAYLESSTPRSRALYAHHGFEVVGEFNLPGGGPPLWRMWRAPRA